MKWILLVSVLLCSGCSSFSYRRSSFEVAAHTKPFDYQDSDVEVRWRWDIMR